MSNSIDGESVQKTFIIYGNPIALARPRFGHKHVFDSQHFEKLNAGLSIRNQMGDDPLFQNCPLFAEIIFFIKMPKCNLEKRSQLLDTYHYTRADLDNLIKFLLDICNNVVYKDDCLISKIIATKIYGEEPSTKFTIGTL
jgi:Holliday junction resolvase RusA-like endonuclease